MEKAWGTTLFFRFYHRQGIAFFHSCENYVRIRGYISGGQENREEQHKRSFKCL